MMTINSLDVLGRYLADAAMVGAAEYIHLHPEVKAKLEGKGEDWIDGLTVTLKSVLREEMGKKMREWSEAVKAGLEQVALTETVVDMKLLGVEAVKRFADES